MKKNYLTVIFMKDTNRPLTYQISIKLLIFVIVLMAGIASTYAFFIKGYYSLYKDNQQLENIVRTLKTDMGELQNTIEGLKSDDQQVATADTTPSAPVPAPRSEATMTSNEPLLESTGEVAIEQLRLAVDRQAGKLSFTFDLDNTIEDGSVLRGYLFVVLKSQADIKLTSFPEVDFRDGRPVDYHQGDIYAIRRFKGYRGDLDLSEEASLVEVLVYSDTGKLITHVREPVPAS